LDFQINRGGVGNRPLSWPIGFGLAVCLSCLSEGIFYYRFIFAPACLVPSERWGESVEIAAIVGGFVFLVRKPTTPRFRCLW